MYAFSKRTLSHYIRGECRRRLRLDLYDGDGRRRAADAPVRDVSRPGLALLAEQGRSFEREKFSELSQIFAGRVIHGLVAEHHLGEERAFGKIELKDHIGGIEPHQFLIEAQFEVEQPFIDVQGLGDLCSGSALTPGARLRFAEVRPDIIHVMPPPQEAREAITPLGEVVTVAAGDPRLGLRIIDIKLTGEPSPAHFAELAYYGMTLAAWLEYHGYDRQLIVLKNAAVWPGKHDASEIRKLESEDRTNGVTTRSLDRYLEGLREDLETMPAEVVLGRVRRFFAVDLREVLLEPDWRSLPWHVDSGCGSCDYLGYSWKKVAEAADEGDHETDRAPYCWAMAEASGHLSRVTGLTRGACGKLKVKLVESVEQLASLSASNPAFDEHQKLRAGRTLFQARSEVLTNKLAPRIPDRAGTSAVLPARSHIKVALSTDFDVGSGLTFAIGYQIVAAIPSEQVQEDDGRIWFKSKIERSQPRVMLVEQKSLDAERDVLMAMMQHLVEDLDASARNVEDAYRRLGKSDTQATVQVYLWDTLNYDHLCRIMGRHLMALLSPPAQGRGPRIAPMAWMFPAEQVIEDPDFASTNSPISIVSDAAQALLAADVPHHYSLLGVANAYHPERLDRADGTLPFRVNKFFFDPLSDQIPSERGHEIWNKRSPFRSVDWQAYRDTLKRVVRVRLDALHAVVERLTDDLKGTLTASAPSVRSILDQTSPLGAVSQDSEILYQHARLMAAAEVLEVARLMAMPPHQREATFESARLEARLVGPERIRALENLGLKRLEADDTVYVFRMSHRSLQAKVKVGDFNWSLMPEAALGLQHKTIAQLKRAHPTLEMVLGPAQGMDFRTKVRDACKVDVLAFERASGLAVLKAGNRPIPRFLRTMEQSGIFDFALDGSRGVFAILDPLSIDYFVKRYLRPALKAIRVPPLSRTRPLFRNAVLTRLRRTNPRQTSLVPAERFIWDADRLATECSARSGDVALEAIQKSGRCLTRRQAEAVRQSMKGRLALLWGPPGTGKSTTAVALILGLLADADRRGVPIRIAITGPTWVAIDTVAKKIPALLREAGYAGRVDVARLASSEPSLDGIAGELRGYLVLTDSMGAHQKLAERLEAGDTSVIVAGTPQQLAKLTLDEAHPMRPFFDFLLVDEASQMSVAHAVVAFATLADGASLTVVGDDLQMPPIQPIEPPEGAEHLVGSIYDFYRQYRKGEPGANGIDPVMLDMSYRSNREIIEFVRQAGYRQELSAAFPDIRMRLASPIPEMKPIDWPNKLPWHEHLAAILDAQEPLTAVIHPDEYSSQRNEPEAELVTGLVRSLYGRLLPEAGDEPFDGTGFFKEGVGIVTPHRAQQAAVIERLEAFLPNADRAAMIASVDTVERFQGQEKIVMFASFGLGDADQIAAEEEFLYSLNRFNVIASRAKTKLIVIMSQKLVDYLPRDPEMLRQSRLLKHYADGYLRRLMPLAVPGFDKPCLLKLR